MTTPMSRIPFRTAVAERQNFARLVLPVFSPSHPSKLRSSLLVLVRVKACFPSLFHG